MSEQAIELLFKAANKIQFIMLTGDDAGTVQPNLSGVLGSVYTAKDAIEDNRVVRN